MEGRFHAAVARLLFSLGRDRLFPHALNRIFAQVHDASGVPRAATLVMAAFSALCCLLSSRLLLVFMSGLLVYGWGLVCLAVLVGRKKGLTGQDGCWRSPLYPLGPLLGFALAVAFAIADLADADAGRPSVILLGVVMAASILWSERVLKRRGWRPTLSDVNA